MLGAIIGDIVGSTREWHNIKTEDFELIPAGSRFTDDTVMTLAVAEWLMKDQEHQPDTLVECMQALGRKYFDAGYGGMFRKWLMSDNPQPYGSYGNGSAMRVSPVGLYANSLEEALELARVTASVTHNHPEGIKGAQAIAACVYMRRNQVSPEHEMKQYIEQHFGYNLNQKLEDIRPAYGFDVTCQGSVPIAIMAHLQQPDEAEKALRLAISMGGDSDTIGCMTAAIATTKCKHTLGSRGFSEETIELCRSLLPADLLDINDRFEAFIDRPLWQSYEVNGDRLFYAGEYPGDKYGAKAEWKIRQMVHFGVKHFVDLTEEGELKPYSHLLPKGCTYLRFPIQDVSAPKSVESVHQLLHRIDELQKQGGYVYLHCWGGVGRTGTIIACYLAKQMGSPTLEKVLAELHQLFAAMPKASYRETPETKEQIEFINHFIEYLNKSQNTSVNSHSNPENINNARRLASETEGMVFHPIPIKLYEEDASKMENMTLSEKMEFMEKIRSSNRFKVAHQSPEIEYPDYILNTDSNNHHKIAISEKTFAIIAKTKLYSNLYAWGLDFDRDILSVVAKDCRSQDYPYGQFVVLLDDGTINEIWSEKCIKPVFQNNYFCAVACGCGGLVFGLRNDGRVEVGNNQQNQEIADEVSKWTDIEQIDAGPQHVVGLTKDKKVIAAGKPSACEPLRKWENIQRIYVSKMCGLYFKENALTFGIDCLGWLHIDGDTWEKGREFWKRIRAQYDVTDVIEDGYCVWIRTRDEITRAITYYSPMNYLAEINFVKKYPNFRYYDSYGALKVLIDKEGEFHVLYNEEEVNWWNLKAVDPIQIKDKRYGTREE